ncbi:MAG: DMT family transporter [Syntrophales bacterium]|nr:DMT family transporter [Syntrophales bacterium]
MAWFFFSLLSAFSLATADAITKRYFSSLSPLSMGFLRLICTLPWLFLSLPFIPDFKIEGEFWICIAFGLPLEVVAFYCYMRAIKVSPLSLTLPFLAFTPVFISLTGWIILDERVSLCGFAGIVLIVLGAYTLNLSSAREGFLMPFKAILKEQGSWLMFLVAFIYAFTSVMGRKAILHSNPFFFAVIYNLALTGLVAFIYPVMEGGACKKLYAGVRVAPVILLGLVEAISILSHVFALSLTQTAYMIALKRTSVLFGVLYGALLFSEEQIKERFLGAFLMLIGVFVMASVS